MRTQMLVLACLFFYAVPLFAESYSWTDDNGTTNFTEEYSKIPVKYRKKVRKRDDISGQSVPGARELDAVSNKSGQSQQPQPAGVNVAPAPVDTGNGLYGGKNKEAWQLEFQARGAELRRLEQQLAQLEALIKKPVGISKERTFGLPQEFKETQKQYQDAFKRYNDLNDSANKAGVPTELRK